MESFSGVSLKTEKLLGRQCSRGRKVQKWHLCPSEGIVGYKNLDVWTWNWPQRAVRRESYSLRQESIAHRRMESFDPLSPLDRNAGFKGDASTWPETRVILRHQGWLCRKPQWKCELFSHVQLIAVLWAVACQAPLSMEFSQQDYWSR